MSKSIIWELVKINILYSNPQLLASVKKKQSKRKDASFSAYKSVLLQQVFMVLSFGLLYSVFFMGVDYSQSIGFFSLQLALFTIIAIVYGFTGFFSVFYDSKDTKLYLALPLKPQEVFLAKILSAQGMVLPFLMPCLSLLLITYWQIGGPLLALASIPSFLILWILANLVNLIIMHFVGEVLTKSPRKTLISTILMTGSSLLAFAALMFLQSQQTVSLESGGFVDFPIIPIFAGFHYLVSHTISLETLLHFGLPFILMIGLIVFAFKTVIPNYFNQVLAIENASTKRTNNAKSAKIPSNLNQALVKHHLSTLKDSNLMVQTMIQPIIMGVALFPSFSRFTENGGLSSVEWDFLWYCSISWILAWQSICWFYNLHRSSHVIGKGKLSFHSNTSYKFQKIYHPKILGIGCRTIRTTNSTLLCFGSRFHESQTHSSNLLYSRHHHFSPANWSDLLLA